MTEDVPLVDLTLKAHRVQVVLVEMLVEKDLECASIATTEHICVLLDPRQKMRFTDECFNDEPALREKAELDAKHVGDGFTDQETPQTPTVSPVAGAGDAAGGAAGGAESGVELVTKKARLQQDLHKVAIPTLERKVGREHYGACSSQKNL